MGTNEESDGFKFAITLLVAFGTIVSAAYIFLQNNAVGIKYFGSSFISGALSILGFIFSMIFGWPNIVHIREYIIESFSFIKWNKFNDWRTIFGLIIAVVILVASVFFWLPFLSMTLDSL